jgi:hypothetical protein
LCSPLCVVVLKQIQEKWGLERVDTSEYELLPPTRPQRFDESIRANRQAVTNFSLIWSQMRDRFDFTGSFEKMGLVAIAARLGG